MPATARRATVGEPQAALFAQRQVCTPTSASRRAFDTTNTALAAAAIPAGTAPIPSGPCWDSASEGGSVPIAAPADRATDLAEN
jgi:hypothetical protein